MQAEPQRPLPEWLPPVLVAAVAVPTFAAFWIGGQPRLGVGPKSVVPSGPPWRLGVSKPPAPRRTPDETAR